MDQGDAAVWAAAISAVSTVVGGLGGYLAGRAQGRAAVDGVKLQLDGQREDAVWQAEVDAFAELVAQLNTARMQVGNAVALCDADPDALQNLERLGFGTRENVQPVLTGSLRACLAAENSLRFRTEPAYADRATEVNQALSDVVSAVVLWGAARMDGVEGTSALRSDCDAKVAVFRSTLSHFIEDAQGRFARSRAQ
ncbi:hypothetical protein [Streptomyces sp. NPDC047869]|uniref:hypothetical protein n=1 Tax=Streptomyces sp. NPDC047869 TaxID=3154709 RepID=UPI003456FAE5